MSRHQRTRNRADKSSFNMSSMIDVVFLLLIYFILTQTPIIECSVLKATLPSPKPQPRVHKPDSKPFYIEVNQLYPNDPEKDLNYYVVRNRVYHINAVKSMLSSMVSTSDKKDKSRLIISCDVNAQHRKLVNLLDACYEEKFHNISVVSNAGIPYHGKKQ